jgi:hypothetical protein
VEEGLALDPIDIRCSSDDMKVVKLQEEQDTGSCEISAAENFLKLI